MTVTKATIRSRLYAWNENEPPGGYDQNAWHEGPDGKQYRQDCSGYVSMLTGMTGNPATIAMVTETYSRSIRMEDLTFGDILIVPPRNGRGGHVTLFDSWQVKGSSYLAHDFGYGSEPHHRVLPYPYPDTRAFLPRRLNVVDQGSATPTKPPAATPAPGKPKPSTNTNAAPPFPGTVRRGSRGGAVTAVQSRLRARGWKIGVDGIFGPATEDVVEKFQAEKRITVDGVVGRSTWTALWTAPVT